MHSAKDRDAPIAAWNSYWLIERPVEGRAHPEYWAAAAVAPVGEWTDDPWKATRYATQEDAERALRPRGGFALPGTAKAISHGFEEPA